MSSLGYIAGFIHSFPATLNAFGVLVPVGFLLTFIGAFFVYTLCPALYSCCGKHSALRTSRELKNVLVLTAIVPPTGYIGILRAMFPPGQLFKRLGAMDYCVCMRCRISYCWRLMTWLEAAVGEKQQHTPA